MEQNSLPQNGSPKNKTILYVIIGAVIVCCLCCILALVGQYFLEHSNFSLVSVFRPFI